MGHRTGAQWVGAADDCVKLFTVFTPTFNRRTTLHRVYDSLCAQSIGVEHFEWLVVDDGSTDGTAEQIATWARVAAFPIRYVWQENGGKHRAWNRGVVEAAGELFLFFDSDDACTPDALEKIAAVWTELDAAERATLAGVLTRCCYPDGRPCGPPLPPLTRADFAALVLVHGLRTETWMAMRTAVLREHTFPSGPRGKLVPESTLWHLIARHHRWVVLDERLRIYYADEFGSADQLSRPRPLRDQAPGLVLAYESLLENSWRHFFDAPFVFARSAMHLSRFSLHSRRSPLSPLATLGPRGARALYATLLPLGVSMYLADRFRRRG